MIPFAEEQPRRSEEKGPFVFRLYVVDEGPGSARAIANLIIQYLEEELHLSK